MTPLERAMQALRPFSEFIEWAERNGHPLDDLDLLVRRDGRVLGHAGFTVGDLAEARATQAIVESALTDQVSGA